MISGLTLIGVLMASVLIGVCAGVYDARGWSGMAQRARRFVSRGSLPPRNSD